jgi:hypothetical protein
MADRVDERTSAGDSTAGDWLSDEVGTITAARDNEIATAIISARRRRLRYIRMEHVSGSQKRDPLTPRCHLKPT